MTSKAAALVALAAADAADSVARETDAGILGPRYAPSALYIMGWERSYGASKAYRLAYAPAFVMAWVKRYALASEAALAAKAA